MHTRTLCAALALGALAPLSIAQSPYATHVVSFSQGSGGGVFVTDNVLDGPLGGGLGSGSIDVLTLGDGGSVTLGFDVVLRNGPGADLIVFENGFAFGTSVFAEVAFVEISTNGVDFARFPSSYVPPSGGSTPMGTFYGMCGGMPIVANVSTDPTSPFDPVRSGGEALDLAELAGHPLVIGGQLDLQDVNFVRLVDVAAGDVDSNGVPISGGTSADVDAVALLHHDAEPANGPICDLSVDDQGRIVWKLGDPDGFYDLDFASLSSSVQLAPLSILTWLTLFEVTAFDGNVAELRTLFPIPIRGLTAVLAVSVRDFAGSISGDQVYVQG
jgi:hypothetical protein